MASIRTLTEQYIKDRVLTGHWTRETEATNAPRLRAFAKWAPRAMQIADVKPPLIHQYMSHLMASKWKGQPLTGFTVNKHLTSVGALFKFARILGHTEINPCEGIKVSLKNQHIDSLDRRVPIPAHRVLEVAELGLVPRIMAYTGARNTEVIQLRARDVREEDGVLVLDLSARDAGQRRKSRAALRLIPVHPELRPHLLARIERAEPDDLLSTDPRQPTAVFRSFNNRIKAICGGPQFTLYGLRHAFVDGLRGVIPDNHLMQLMGHAQAELIHSLYGSRVPLQTLAESISSLSYEPSALRVAS